MLDDRAQVLLALSAASLARWLASVWSSRARRDRFVRVGEVSELYLFPVKSCQGIPLRKARTEVTGLESDGLHDRQWMLMRPNGEYVSQRHFPKLALVRVSSHQNDIHLDAPDQPTLILQKNPPVDTSSFIMANVTGVSILAMDCGDQAGLWFQTFLQREGFRLVVSLCSMPKRETADKERPWGNPAKIGDLCTFSDNCPYMLMTEASLDALNMRLTKKVGFKTFRPSIVISGCEAFAEDWWEELRIGDTSSVNFRILDPCTKCILPNVNPDTGERNQDKEPLQTLKKFRCFPPYGRDPIFGVNAALDNTGTIQVGDPVYAIRK
ncbi:mitochondrial amidoxime-reducing component 1-like [Ostrea edulis]|uniref:mitochondrial amidoxime-reducing component 1-like n=1 Tax=Ostrea edulis TaxID=37623 RepID=UPI0020964702|nr:mitochondrial amidoxime-reducing component 1-like [Ostrea edulis]